ncbi:MAG TPA: ferritin-like protein [Pyrinomonadaceae bacterium]|jgi:hypothetical protein|nr:ferritin-like protein [Pyrinomonadaceae bacterium]
MENQENQPKVLLEWKAPQSIEDIYKLVQTAIDLEFSTLPPYLYAKFSIPDGMNPAATDRIQTIVEQEMIHMCLACNIMNALSGTVGINPPSYPGHLPGDVGGKLEVHLYTFSEEAMKQGMDIETPEDPIDPPVLAAMRAGAPEGPVTIGQFYAFLDAELAKLPPTAWTPNRNQIGDAQFFQGQLFPVNNYNDAHQAISDIVSEGEGSPTAGSPLDFENELAHFYRFEEIYRNKVLVKDDNPVGYAWNGPLGVDWTAVYPAINDPEEYDFSKESQAVQDAQTACNAAFTSMVDELQSAFNGNPGRLGNAVAAMFKLRMAALHALVTPLADGKSVAGPSFLYLKK